MVNSGNTGEKLVFLISQPRAGSTLLQLILGNHEKICTTAEPWIMLPPLFSLREDGYKAVFDWPLAWQAIRDFLDKLPNGEEDYLEGVRHMYTYLYDRYLKQSGKELFLDKTPRYYLIINELHRTFPDAHFIILLRNPLAILLSLLNTWSIYMLFRFKEDLFLAPYLLIEGIKTIRKRSMVLHYEELVATPETEIRKILEWLEIEYSPDLIHYTPDKMESIGYWGFGDKVGVSQYNRPVQKNAQKWIEALDDPQFWRLANDYLSELGSSIVEQLGYSYDELMSVLDAHRPSNLRLLSTIPMDLVLIEPSGGNIGLRRILARFTLSMHRRGLRETAFKGIRKITKKFTVEQDA